MRKAADWGIGLALSWGLLLLAPFILAQDSVGSTNREACGLLAVCAQDAAPKSTSWANDAYIWQRSWTPAVGAAIEQSSDVMDGWRVLGAQASSDGRVRSFSPDWAALNESGKPLILVIRIERQLIDWDEDALLEQISSLIVQWRGKARHLAGIEIDHDCATARLSDYARFLTRVRALLTEELRLSITALPDWLASPDLPALLDAADSTVLQVHAIEAPEAGIFDRDQAMAWIDRFSHLTRKPFRVALPAYGARLALRPNKSVFAVESERPLLVGGDSFIELTISPRDVADLLRHVADAHPEHLSGIVWFRLPVAGDERAWSLATLRAVIERVPLKPHIAVQVGESGIAGAVAISLANEGGIDARLPRRVVLPADCTIADGINGFSLDHEGERLVLVNSQAMMLHEGHRIAIGWARCKLSAENVDVEE